MEDIFIANDFKKEYFEIINNSNINYGEEHHIIPKSLGGPDDKYNLVKLTPEDHFKCHILLPYFTTGEAREKMIYAWNLMSNIKGQPVNYEEYSYLKVVLREQQVKNNTGSKNPMYGVDRAGEKNPMFGYPHPNKGKKVPQTGNQGSDNGMYGKTHTHEVKQKLSQSQSGRTKIYQGDIQKSVKPEELIYYIIDGWKIGLLYKTETCKYCGITGKKSQMTRYHHVMCKLNDSLWEEW